MKGKITIEKKGMITVYNCSCGAGCAEANDDGITCINAPKHNLNGCGAFRAWDDAKVALIKSKMFSEEEAKEALANLTAKEK